MRRSVIRGYQGYRGRGRGNGHKWLIALLVLVLLAACAFLYAQRFVVYSSDGSMHYEWPWVRRSAVEPERQGQGEQTLPELEIVTDAPETPEKPKPTVKPETPPVPQTPAEPEITRAVELPASVLQGSLDKTLQELAEQPVNTLAIRVKNVRGELLYPSKIDGAVRAQAVVGGSIARSAIEELNGSEFRTIARISALHDSLFSFAHMSDAAIQQVQYSGYIWYAPDSTFYLAPEKEMARQYLADIARECAEMGFDELLFDEFGYPSEGRLSNIKTNARTMSKEEALALLAAALREAAGDDVRLSLVLDAETALAGANETTGQSVALLAPYFDRFYIAAAEEQIPALEAALADCGAELALIVPAPVEGHPYLIGR